MKRLLISLLPMFALLSPVADADEDTKALETALKKRLPSVEITRIDRSPVDGLYQVTVGTEIVYMTRDARYMLQGDLVDLMTRKNHTESAKSDIRLSMIEDFGEKNMLIYTPDTVKHTITVVTDIDCPYCRRLHAEMPVYMAKGIRVRYIFMPLKGQSDYEQTVSVWCSDNRHAELDKAKGPPVYNPETKVKERPVIPPRTCDNPIDEHIKLAGELGVRGTPAIILSDGTMLPGYIPVEKLASQLDMLNLGALER